MFLLFKIERIYVEYRQIDILYTKLIRIINNFLLNWLLIINVITFSTQLKFNTVKLIVCLNGLPNILASVYNLVYDTIF